MFNYLYKIIITFLFSIVIISNSYSNEIDCSKFEKLSAKFIECNAKKLKEKINEDIEDTKKNINENELTKKLKKFKNSKTLSDLGEN
tara:strand:- start:957 stop:1217 length:261 start_codon:yes stop_codon:yes gene_type:complete